MSEGSRLDVRVPLTRSSYVVLVCFFSVLTATVQAKVIYVDSRATGTGDGSTWSNALVDLQTALGTAQDADEIRVAQGIYTPNRGDEARQGFQPDRAFLFNVSLELKGGYAGTGHATPNARDVLTFRTVLSGDREGNDPTGSDWLHDESARQDNRQAVIRWNPNMGKRALIEGFHISGADGAGRDEGGAIQAWLKTDCKLTLRDCHFFHNRGELGGAMRIYGNGYEDASTRVENCHLYSNVAEMGACAYVFNSRISFANCVFNTNEALRGGAVYLRASLAEFTHCTFNNNLADRGDAVDCDFSLCFMQNSIVWGRPGPISLDLSTVLVQYCNIAGGFFGEGNIEADPLFVNPLGEDGINGTEDDNLQLLPISPCVNSGNVQVALELLDEDIAGNARMLGGQVDIGAYEFQGVIFVDGNAPHDPGPGYAGLSDPDENGTPDHPFDSVSEAMEIAWDGFTVLVAEGIYGPVDVSDRIFYRGRNIQLKSLDPQDLTIVQRTILGYTIEFEGTEGPSCELSGFKLQGRDSYFGIVGNGTQATVRFCMIQGNHTCDGIVVDQLHGRMENCLITDNTSSFACGERSVVEKYSGTMQNCTIANNTTGVHLLKAARVVNCIFYHNQGAALLFDSAGPPHLAYSNIQGIEQAIQEGGLEDLAFKGLLDEDPRFVRLGQWSQGQLSEGDYHLKSRGLRWLDSGDQVSLWTQDSVTSPSIDTGDPSMTPANELIVMPASMVGLQGVNTRINMGYYGGTTQASFHHIFPIMNMTPTDGDHWMF